MNDNDRRSELASLRQAFDDSFRETRAAIEPRVGLVLLRIGGVRYAVRATDLLGVQGARRIVPLSGGGPHLLGVAGVHGVAVPVFDLAAALGLGVGGERRWLLLCGDMTTRTTLLALAVEQVEGFERALASTIRPIDRAAATSQFHARVDLDGELVAIADAAALTADLRRRAGEARRTGGGMQQRGSRR